MIKNQSISIIEKKYIEMQSALQILLQTIKRTIIDYGKVKSFKN